MTEDSSPRRTPLVRILRILRNPLPWAILVLAVVVWANRRLDDMSRSGVIDAAGELPVLATVPAFDLKAQSGEPFGSEQLRDRVWIANFIFTRCPSICPELSRRMAALQESLGEEAGVSLVSFSVDPDYDTPEVLAKYAVTYGARAGTWFFLTGPWEVMRGAVEDGLKVSTGNDGGEIDVNTVLHGTRFVLVDAELRIRGYYDVSTPDGFESLVAAALELTKPLPPAA